MGLWPQPYGAGRHRHLHAALGARATPGGACFRIVEIAPADDGGSVAGTGEPGEAEHAEFQGAHATSTLDYVTILRGEVTLVAGGHEVVLRPGDSVVQQPGVPHDWQNRSAASAVMVGVLLSTQ